MDRTAFAERLAKLRTNKGLSQQQLAVRLGVKHSAVSYYESGDRLPSYDVLIEMSRVFSVTTDYLLKGQESGRIIQVPDLSEEEIGVIADMVEALRKKHT